MTPFRTLIIGLVSLIIGINPLFSEYINPYDGTNKMLYQKKNTAYSIYIPGKKVSSGWTPAKIINIPRVPKEDYMPGAIHIKTRSRIEYDKNANLLYSSALMSDLINLNIKNIRSPFAFTGDNMLEVDKIGTDRILEIYYSSPVDPYDACIALLNNPEVEYAVPVFMYKTFDYTPNDPRLTNQWYVSNIQLPKAWDLSKGSTDVVIGIVDSGTDWLHEDLAANIWTNPGEIPNNGIDDDKNGKIDDVRGWDLVGNVNQNQIAIGQYAEDNDPRNTGSGSTNTHGTHVAGCASAVADNGKGIAGPGFKCKLMPVKCATDQNGIAGIFRGYEGITYAANNGAKIINCSWGGPG